MKHSLYLAKLPGALCVIPALALAAFVSSVQAHEWHRFSIPNPGPEREALRAKYLADWIGEHGSKTATVPGEPGQVFTRPVVLASSASSISAIRLAIEAAASGAQAVSPSQAKPFQAFPNLQLRWDQDYLFVGSNGLPDHNMMVGITNWQQQVPLPQAYFGDNAWRIPLHPVVAKQPVSIRGRFLRGAIALAVNGIPIFNPQNNRGEVSQEIGELDQWGGHCGRADDYHYHAAPLHLQAVVGKGQPIAYALDGYPIYGLAEPDGSAPTGLDAFDGHETAALGYHYHASTKYPYVNGGFHGEVVEAGGQVDPQPRANPVRGAGTPLRGAKITGFESTGPNAYKLTYEVDGDKQAIRYNVNADGTMAFEYQNGSNGINREVYTRRNGLGGGPRGPGEPGRGGPDQGRRPGPNGLAANEQRPAPPPATTAPPASTSPPQGSFVLTSSVVANGGAYPVEFTGDGSGSTPPLAWTGAPAGVKGYALIMHHLDPEGKTKWYWIIYNIPANVQSLPKNVQGIGTVGTGFKGHIGYEPPHSKGPGPKTYVLTLYALSAPPDVTVAPAQVTYDVMMQAMKGRVLASADLSVVYTRGGN